jgi:hypothetical protein
MRVAKPDPEPVMLGAPSVVTPMIFGFQEVSVISEQTPVCTWVPIVTVTLKRGCTYYDNKELVIVSGVDTCSSGNNQDRIPPGSEILPVSQPHFTAANDMPWQFTA